MSAHSRRWLYARTGHAENAAKRVWRKNFQIGGFAAAVALVLTAGLSLTLPIAVRRVIDNFSNSETGLLDTYFAAALGIAGLLAIGTALRYMLVTKLGERVVADIRKEVFARVIDMSPSFYENLRTGEVLSRITTDTTLVLTVIGSSVSIALRNALIFIGGLFFMLLTSAKLTSLVLLIVPLVLVPILTLGRKVRRLSKENQDWVAAGSAQASEALGAVQTIQAFTHEEETKNDFSKTTEDSFLSARERIRARALMTFIVIFLVFSGIIGVLWIGAHDVSAGKLSAGTLVQFVIYSVMVGGSVAALSEVWGELQRAAGATDRLAELLKAEDSISDPSTATPHPNLGRGHLTFENVIFNYPSRPQYSALDDVSFDVKPGQTVAIVGPSGAGKTTIIQLLLRFYDPQGGSILLDGVDLRDMRREDFRKAISLVPQDSVIFANSVLENIRFGRQDASDEEVISAANLAAAHQFISELPEGYETYVGERGVMLSGGQKQRIAIARAILRDAPVLLLDEATSALDSESERAVQKAVDALAQDRT
ncbi:MAG: ATP-binding cassette domain-containing protein, partial [Rhodobacteraceae bacterium]|nr:ATP-binding cassette domain-containing protein [Paracoccaceae bacterium]